MGRKCTRARKYIYFSITGLIFILLLGCTSLEKLKVKIKEPEENHQNRNLLYSLELLYQGDYEGALKECQQVLSHSSPSSPKDKALFNMGLIYAYPDNPKKDYEKSLDVFRRLTKDYPQSDLANQAKTWIGVLIEYEKLKKTNEKLNQTNEKLNQTIEKLNQIIEKSKQVDIEIEEKKRVKTK